MSAKAKEPPLRVRTEDAVRITGLDRRTLQEKAAAGKIPGARKVFGRWTYDPLILESLGTDPCQMKSSPRASTDAEKPYGRVSKSKVSNIAKAYEHVLSQSRKSA